MKTFLFQYFILFSFTLINKIVNANGASSFNGVKVGRSYKPVGNNNPVITHRYSADPSAMIYNNRVYVYSSNDGDASSKDLPKNTFTQITSINVMSSADLVNWMDHGSIPATGSFKDGAQWAQNSWAPAACHKKINGKEKFFVYFADSGRGIGVLEGDSPTGPFKDPIGEPLITHKTPNSDVEWLFDPACIVDSNGDGYLYFGGGIPEGNDGSHPNTIRVVKLGDDMISLAGTPKAIDAPWVLEDSGINKIGNTYYYSYCTNWMNGPYGNAVIGYMTSKNPMGPFTYKNVCLNNPGFFNFGYDNNHHSIIEFKNNYYIIYHTTWLNTEILGEKKNYRATHIDYLPFDGSSFGNAKATLIGVSQLSNVNGFLNNNAACFAWQSNVKVTGYGEVTHVNYSSGSWTGVSNVELYDSTKIIIKASSKNGATIKITTDSENGTVLGYVDIPPGSSLKHVSGKLTGASGTKHLFFISSGEAIIESWTLINEDIDSIPEGWYFIKGVQSKKYLTAVSAKANANVEIRKLNKSNNQKWKITKKGDYITLTSGLGNFMLDVANGKNEKNVNILIYEAYGGEAQQFSLKKVNDNSYVITTRVSGCSKALDVSKKKTDDGTNVAQYNVSYKPNQLWIFEKTTAPKTNK